MTNKPTGRKENIVVQELEGEVLVYDLKDNRAFCLNQTSAIVWEMCDGNNSISDIAKGLSEKMKSPVNDDLVWLALDQLKQEDLIVDEIPTPAAFEGMNRRDVIKKVGLASMIALPIVAGMVAPKAAHAASLRANGAACSGGAGSSSTCASGCCCSGAVAGCVANTCTAVPAGGAPAGYCAP